MIRSLMLFLAISLTGSSLLLAAGHDACNDIGYDWSHLTASELRSVASSCQNTGYSELNFHRAQYLDLLARNANISSMVYHARLSTESNISARLLHMVLVEQLVPYYLPAEDQQLNLLNREYGVNNEFAELRLRKYAELAKRLDRLQSRKK